VRRRAIAPAHCSARWKCGIPRITRACCCISTWPITPSNCYAVELLADRGIDARVDPRLWHGICNTLAQGLAQDLSVKPVLAAIAQIHALLTEHFPADAGRNPNELDDRPIIL